MRSDEAKSSKSSNGFGSASNGSPDSARKSAITSSLNGHATSTSHTNGTNGVSKRSTPVRSSTYRGHNREEVTRILIQGLRDLGYEDTAQNLSRESGYELESGAVSAFRNAVLDGQWAEAEAILVGSHIDGDFSAEAENGHSDGLILAETADRGEMLFWLRKQKFLELLEQRELSLALMVLRQELTPLNHDINQLHALSSLLMCPAEDLRSQAQYEGSAMQSREALLLELTKSISPSVMIPDHRLATLLDQVKQSQINHCLYHNTAVIPSLYSDHMCDRANFPLRTMRELEHHTDEVWFVQFSHDGSKLATASRDATVIIYDANNYTVLHRLTSHGKAVAYLSWSPDDTKIISCSQDKKARLWDVQTGRCTLTLDHREEPVTTASWAPDGSSFVTGTLELDFHMVHWSVNGENLHTWKNSIRVQDCAITPDGRRLVVITSDKKLCVYDFRTHAEEYRISFPVDLTCITITRDSRHMLLSTGGNEIQLLDIETTDVIRKYEGQKQGSFVIRSSFGGAAENFVISGSEDSQIYIWHKENGQLVEKLKGHTNGCVNAVSWHPRDPGIFVSAGDDRRVRIWSNSAQLSDNAAAGGERSITSMGPARTSAMRSTFWGDGGSNL